MKQISVLIKPASSLCNLRCSYCFYSDVSENRLVPSTGVMSAETTETLVRRIAEAIDGKGIANIAFQGGEPTVAGLEYFEHFTSLMDEYPDIEVHYGIQTNATLIDEKWAQFLHKHHFLVGVSLDGYQTNMDRFRYDVKKRGVFYQVLRGIDELKKAGVEFNILTVVTSELARHPKALFEFYRDHHFEYIQLIPCLPGLMEDENEMSLTPELYASFYKEFFRYWLEYMRKGGFMSVNLFENVMGMCEGIPPYQCGYLGRCVTQYVIEANGDVYPCDFYCTDEYLLGNIKDLSMEALQDSETAKDFMKSPPPVKKICGDCPFKRICNGACKRQNICFLKDDYCAYREVLEEIVPVFLNTHR